MPRTYLINVNTLADHIGPYQAEPVTVEDVKLYLQLEGDAYNAPISMFIKAARRLVEKHCNVSLVPKKLVATFETHGISKMSLPFPPYEAVQKVEWKKCPLSWLELNVSEGYNIVNDLASQCDILSTQSGLHRVTFTTKAPDDIYLYQQAIIAQAGYMYTHRDDANGMAPEAKALLSSSRNISI